MVARGAVGRGVLLVTREVLVYVIERSVWVFQQVDQLPVRAEKRPQELVVFGGELPRLRTLIKLFQLVDVQLHQGAFVGLEFLLTAAGENAGRVDNPRLL